MPARACTRGLTRRTADAEEIHVLFESRDGRSYLIDPEGNAVKTWPYTGWPTEMIPPELNGGRKGHVFVLGSQDIHVPAPLLEVDWDGKIVWQWGPQGASGQNHDLVRLANGNTLVISIVRHHVPGIRRRRPNPGHAGNADATTQLPEDLIDDQAILELTPGGDVIWQWLSCDHLAELGVDAVKRTEMSRPELRPGTKGPLNINDLQPLGPNKWYEGGDKRFNPENLMIDSREANFIAILDRHTGDVRWRMGPDFPASYDHSKRAFRGPLPRPIDSLSGLHDAHLIPEGLPGAGNILLFDNQAPSGIPPVFQNILPATRVLEIDPMSQEIVWQYDAAMSDQNVWDFYSAFAGSARRLNSGNTLICESMYGRIFQVTPDGNIAWEYVNPYEGKFTLHHESAGRSDSNWIYRAQPIQPEWLPLDDTTS